ncbi:MAG: response regulator [Gammaproteobacteria bacterium]
MCGERILVVEDENIVAKDIHDSLLKLEYAVSGMVSSGEKAIKECRKLAPDLVLMDIKLKGSLDGIATAHILKEMNIPVIFITAYSDQDTLGRAKYSEPLGYINKPFTVNDLYTAIEIALHKYNSEMRAKINQRHLDSSLNILKSVGIGLIATDKEWAILFMNHIAEELTGLDFDEVVGNNITETINIKCKEDTTDYKKIITDVLEYGTRITLPPGSCLETEKMAKVPVKGTVSPLVNRWDDRVGILLNIFDNKRNSKRN